MNISNQQFEEWRNEQIESLVRMGCPDAARAFRDLGSIHWSAWEASRQALVIELPPSLADDLTLIEAIQLTGAKVK